MLKYLCNLTVVVNEHDENGGVVSDCLGDVERDNEIILDVTYVSVLVNKREVVSKKNLCKLAVIKLNLLKLVCKFALIVKVSYVLRNHLVVNRNAVFGGYVTYFLVACDNGGIVLDVLLVLYDGYGSFICYAESTAVEHIEINILRSYGHYEYVLVYTCTSVIGSASGPGLKGLADGYVRTVRTEIHLTELMNLAVVIGSHAIGKDFFNVDVSLFNRTDKSIGVRSLQHGVDLVLKRKLEGDAVSTGLAAAVEVNYLGVNPIGFDGGIELITGRVYEINNPFDVALRVNLVRNYGELNSLRCIL